MFHDVLLAFGRVLAHVELQHPAHFTQGVELHRFDAHVLADKALEFRWGNFAQILEACGFNAFVSPAPGI